MKRQFTISFPDHDNANSQPLSEMRIAAGFPSPVEDSYEPKLNLNDLVVKNPLATFFVQVEGESMIEANIQSGDILVVDRSLQPLHNSIVIAKVDSEFTVKRFLNEKNRYFLAPENPNFPSLDITNREGIEIWGIVTYIIHKAV